MPTAEDSFRSSLRAFNSDQDPQQSEGLLGGLGSTISSWTTQATAPFTSTTTTSTHGCFGLTTMQRYTWFIILLGTSLVFFSISLFALPFVLIAPAKFASTWTMGSLLFISSFAFLNGYKAHLQALMSEDRRVFSGVYVCSMLMTLYFSIIVPSWFVIVCIIMQMVALGWYIATYLPGGVGAMASLSRSILPI